MAKIVAETGTVVTGFFNLFKKEERHKLTIVDIGVLRFPICSSSSVLLTIYPTFDLFDYYPFMSITPVLLHPTQGLV